MTYYSEPKSAITIHNQIRQKRNAIVAKQRPYPTHRRPQQPAVTPKPDPIIIDIPQPQRQVHSNALSTYLNMGRQMHPMCRNNFVERVELGYYHYERRTEWRTSALAAAYAGAFGPRSVESPEFSYSMAIWRLSQKLGYDLRQTVVSGPTGRCQPILNEMIQLVDEDGWTRDGIAAWLASLNL